MSKHGGFGLALGGGSLRGAAHVGVLAALDAHHLRPDRVAGTSVGAIVASLHAFGVSPPDMIAAVRDFGWRTMTRIRPLTPIGPVTNKGLETFCVDMLGDVRIENSPIPLAIVATDIDTGERVVMRSGRLAPAVRASSCLPGLYAPVAVEGRRLVDGCLVENVPVRAVRELGSDLVVAVNLGFGVPFDRVRTGVGVVVNALEIAVNSQMREELTEADVLIEPDVSRFSKVRGHDRDDIIDAGRRAAEVALPRIRGAIT
jgi:NTE family protein